MGERSYGIYLLHMPVIFLVSVRGWGIDVGGPVVSATLTALAVVLPCSILLATLSFAGIEAPFLSLRRRYVAPTVHARAAPQAAMDLSAGSRAIPRVPAQPVGAPPVG